LNSANGTAYSTTTNWQAQ